MARLLGIGDFSAQTGQPVVWPKWTKFIAGSNDVHLNSFAFSIYDTKDDKRDLVIKEKRMV